MKKLNTMVTAISLGLTASFAVLPLASAHTTHNVGHSHTVHAHQKHVVGQKYGTKPSSYHTNYHPHVNIAKCEGVEPVQGLGSAQVKDVEEGNKIQNAIATFTYRTDCDNAIKVDVDIISRDEDDDTDVTCKVVDRFGAPLGLMKTVTVADAEDDNTTKAEMDLAGVIKATYGAFPGYSGYAHPFAHIEKAFVLCDNGEPQGDDENDITATAEGFVDFEQPHAYAAPYAANYADGAGYGYAARSIKHIIK